MPPVEPTDKIKAFAAELRKWWRFSNSQQPEHSWHDREDFISRELPRLLAEYCNIDGSESEL